jgi:hypothetical protein
MQSTPEVGQLVVVRKRPFVVTEIIPSAVGNVSGGSAPHLLRLSSVEDDGLGEELRVFWELEPGTSVQENLVLPAPTSFDHPKRLQAFLDAVRWGAVSQADDRALQSPFRSGVALLPASVLGFLPPSVVSRPLMGEQPTVDLVLGYHKANGSQILRKFLSKIDDAIVRVYGEQARRGAPGPNQ